MALYGGRWREAGREEGGGGGREEDEEDGDDNNDVVTRCPAATCGVGGEEEDGR